MTTKQTPREQLDEALRDIWSLALFGMPRETTNSDAVYDAHPDDVVESKRAVLAVVKGLPAMQEEKYNEIERGYAIAYGGQYSDGNKKQHRNELRRQILAEL